MSGSEPTIRIADHPVGTGHATYVIAELSANHHQHLDRALELVDAAADAGADAVKLQTYLPSTLTIDSRQPLFRIGAGTAWENQNLYELYQTAYTPWEWTSQLQDRARDRGIDLFSTPYDASAVEFLEPFDMPAYKVASFELVDIPFIRRVASTGRPMLMSTGMATALEIDEAVAAAREGGAAGVAILRCNSAYPAQASEMDLRTITDMRERWAIPIGLSDHTLGTVSAVAAITLGACILEKHLTMSRDEGGPDAGFSVEPHEFAHLVASVREAEAAVGSIRYGPSERERPSVAFRRSLFVVEPVHAGDILTERSVRSIRPAGGLAPKHLPDVLGRAARHDMEAGTPLSWDDLSGRPAESV